MNTLSRFFAAVALTTTSLLVPVLAQAQDDDVVTECGGCRYLQSGPNYGGNGLANPCGTDLRVTMMGFNGACRLDGAEGCVQQSPCFAGITVEYRSNCSATALWEYGPLGTPPLTIPLPPTPGGTWVSADPILQTLPCGSPMFVLQLNVQDSSGYVEFASAQFRCTPCE